MATIKVAGVGWEMNTEVGLRALESLHERLCVLEEAKTRKLGTHYGKSHHENFDLIGVFNTAYQTILPYHGSLPDNLMKTLTSSIRNSFEADHKIIANKLKFRDELDRMIMNRTYTKGRSQEAYDRVSAQLRSSEN